MLMLNSATKIDPIIAIGIINNNAANSPRSKIVRKAVNIS